MIKEREDHTQGDRQVERAKELRSFLALTQEEHYNMFEMVPQSGMDIYYSKIQSGTIKTACISTNDEKVDKETETDDFD